MFSDEGEGYGYADAVAPGYALYDIDKDGTEELFITPRKDDEWHTYSVYYIKDGVVTRGRALNGYLPDEGLWTYSFDFFTEAYEYSKKDGFTSKWELDYPWVDGIDENTLLSEGQGPKELSDDEVKDLLSGHITEPSDIKWLPLGDKTSAVENTANESLASPVVKDGITIPGEESIQVLFEWNRIDGADGYEVCVENKFCEENNYREPEYCEVTDCSFTAGAQDDFDFRIKVRSYNGSGDKKVFSEWSEYATGKTYD